MTIEGQQTPGGSEPVGWIANEKDPLVIKNKLESHDDEEGHPEANSSTFASAFNMACVCVGAGILSLPYALARAGWIGGPMLVAMGLLSAYTAVILSKCLITPDGRRLYTYAEIGYECFGRAGQIFVELMVHTNLVGAAIVYIILAGTNLSFMLSNIPNPDGQPTVLCILGICPHSGAYIGMVIAGFLVWFHVFIPTLREVGILSAFNILLALGMCIVLIVVIFLNNLVYYAPDRIVPEHQVINWNVLSLGGAYATIAFSYSFQSAIPVIYDSMKYPQQFGRMAIGTVLTIISVFYLPLALIAYWAYGVDTVSPVYDSVCGSLANCDFASQIAVFVVIAAVSIHVLLSYAVVINTTETEIEMAVAKHFNRLPDGSHRLAPWIVRIVLRTFVVLFTIGVAALIPDFADFLDLISSITASTTSLGLPAALYMKMFWGRLGIFSRIFNSLIILLAAIGLIFGVTDAISEILCSVFGVQSACDL